MGFALLLPCTLVLWFAIAYSSFPSLLLVGFGIGLLILFCFIALAAVVFGWLGCSSCQKILGAYLALYCVFCFGGLFCCGGDYRELIGDCFVVKEDGIL